MGVVYLFTVSASFRGQSRVPTRGALSARELLGTSRPSGT
jgi:hypothetical protein